VFPFGDPTANDPLPQLNTFYSIWQFPLLGPLASQQDSRCV